MNKDGRSLTPLQKQKFSGDTLQKNKARQESGSVQKWRQKGSQASKHKMQTTFATKVQHIAAELTCLCFSLYELKPHCGRNGKNYTYVYHGLPMIMFFGAAEVIYFFFSPCELKWYCLRTALFLFQSLRTERMLFQTLQKQSICLPMIKTSVVFCFTVPGRTNRVGNN